MPPQVQVIPDLVPGTQDRDHPIFLIHIVQRSQRAKTKLPCGIQRIRVHRLTSVRSIYRVPIEIASERGPQQNLVLLPTVAGEPA